MSNDKSKRRKPRAPAKPEGPMSEAGIRDADADGEPEGPWSEAEFT